jgi:hypothetical protein
VLDVLSVQGCEARAGEGKVPKRRVKLLEQNVAKIRTRDSLQAFSKLTEEVDGERRIVNNPPLIVPVEDLMAPGTERDALERSIRGLMRPVPAHPGDRPEPPPRAVQLRAHDLQGGRGRQRRHPGVVESVLERFAGLSSYKNHGQRVVAGQRLMQASSDIFLGWQRTTG